jgi:colicin import membrane protein
MSSGFMTSLFLHGAAVGVMLLVAWASSFDKPVKTEVFELVAGEGDNFAATEAPALGTPGGIKVAIPTPPAPKPDPVPVKVVEPEPTPPPPPPTPKPEVKPATVPTVQPPPEAKQDPKSTKKAAPTKERTLTDQFRRTAIVEESKIKMKAEREKAAEKKRLDAERKEKEKAAKIAAANTPRIDAEGIAKGVVGGSTNNKTGGAGGKALSRPDGPVMDVYFAMLKQRMTDSLNSDKARLIDLSDKLVAEVEFRLSAGGAVSGVSIIGPSGSAEFDRAVLDACRRVHMPERPDKESTVLSLTFRTMDLKGS